MEEITARAILAKVVIIIMQSLPNKMTDRAALRQQITQLVSFFPLLPESEAIRRAGEKLVRVSPQCWGTHRSRAWWRIVLAALTAKEAIDLYLGQFPREVTQGQLTSIRRYLLAVAKKRQLAGVNEAYIDSALAIFCLRSNRHYFRENSFRIYFTH